MRASFLTPFAVALAIPAWAFQPQGTVVEPAKFTDSAIGTPSAVHTDHAMRTTALGQARAAQAPGWQAFQEHDGAGWVAVFDEATGSPLRMWGPPIELGDTSSRSAVVQALRGFVSKHASMLGAASDDLELTSAEYSHATGAWYVDFQLLSGGMSGGLPVDGAGVTFRVRDGAISLAGARTYPNAAAAVAPSLGIRDVIDIATVGSTAEVLAVEDIVVPVFAAGGIELRPGYDVQTLTESPRGLWHTVIDGQSGDVLRVRNAMPHLTGQLDAEHNERTMDGSDLVLSPLPHALVTGPDGATYTNADGSYDSAGETATLTLQGRYFRVNNEQGPNASASLIGGNELIDETVANAAELSGYIFAHHVRDWAQDAAPEVNMGRPLIRVNHSGQCNAWYDPFAHSINFLRRGSDCNNTARVADIVYHEWGHGFHDRSVLSGTVDGSMGEGSSDVVAFLQTGDPRVGPYFIRDGREVRNVAPDAVYPEDYNDSPDYVHFNGLIFAGAIWDLWGDLVTLYGPEDGTDRLEAIFTGLLKGGPQLTTAYSEAIFADDDDNDLTNGTPNQCEIFDAFQRHGLGPLSTGASTIFQFTRPDAAAADEPYEVSGDLVDLVPACGSAEVGDGFLRWRADGGDWQRVDLDVTGADVAGTIPPQATGTLVEYTVTLVDSNGGLIEAPGDGLIHPYSYYVGDVIEVFCTDFEDDDGGFVGTLLEGTEEEGALDWQWGVPQGNGGDPSSAASGSFIWGNDLGNPGWDGRYKNNKHTRLESPAFDTSYYTDVFLHYQRWLHVEDGFWDQATITADDDIIWTNWTTSRNNGTDHHMEREWQAHAVDLGRAAEDGQVIIGFEIQSDEGLAFGGWNIDDVCIYAPATADNRLGVTDIALTEVGRRDVRVAWTNPIHAPLDSVVVVRTLGRAPTGPTDGDIVATIADPELAETIEITDEGVPRREDVWYGIFPSDGTQSLGWTVEGWNTARIRLGGGTSGGEGVGVACGCQAATAGGTGAGWLLVGLLGVFTRRRR